MRGSRDIRVAALVAAASLVALSCRERVAQSGATGNDSNVPARLELKVGDPAPDFSLPGSDGKTYRLADYKGKQAVVLAWFAKAFTGP